MKNWRGGQIEKVSSDFHILLPGINPSQIEKIMESGKYPLSNVQLELLKLFFRDLEEKDIVEIRKLIINYLSDKLDRQTSKVWKEKNLSNDDMDDLLNSHLRT
ncbi:MAG: hypothetical protein AAFV25_27755, partial [Bacteroidota bacterium]